MWKWDEHLGESKVGKDARKCWRGRGWLLHQEVTFEQRGDWIIIWVDRRTETSQLCQPLLQQTGCPLCPFIQSQNHVVTEKFKLVYLCMVNFRLYQMTMFSLEHISESLAHLGLHMFNRNGNSGVLHRAVCFSSHVKDVCRQRAQPRHGQLVCKFSGTQAPPSSQLWMVWPSNSAWLLELRLSHPNSRKQNMEKGPCYPFKESS